MNEFAEKMLLIDLEECFDLMKIDTEPKRSVASSIQKGLIKQYMAKFISWSSKMVSENGYVIFKDLLIILSKANKGIRLLEIGTFTKDF